MPDKIGCVNANQSVKPEPELVSKKTKWVVGRGSATVKIYLTPHGGNNYYTLSYWLDGKRKRQVFSTLQAAKDEAAVKAIAFTNGDLGAAKLTNADSAAYCRAIALLEPSGAPLEFAASDYASAVARLGAVSLSQAVDFYLKRHPVNLVSKLVPDVADELIASKRADQLSDRYIKQLTYDMNRFCSRFRNRLGDVSGMEVDAWLRELKLGPRTRNNLRASIQVLFNFGVARKYLPKDHDEIEAIPLAKDKGGEIEIFTPGELTELLAMSSPEQIPFMAISAFAGVRHAEIQRLDWAQVNRKAKIIEIRAGAAKTASRRVIPILPNLEAWLNDHWKDSGPVCSYTNMVDQFIDLTRKVNKARRAAWAKKNGVSDEVLMQADERADKRRVEERKKKTGRRARGTVLPAGSETAVEEGWSPFAWKHNALRHSFISYRVAETHDVAKVSLEAGNSPQMIFKHYRELVQPDAAKEWFAILPAKPIES